LNFQRLGIDTKGIGIDTSALRADFELVFLMGNTMGLTPITSNAKIRLKGIQGNGTTTHLLRDIIKNVNQTSTKPNTKNNGF
jgi:hypothetical protein